MDQRKLKILSLLLVVASLLFIKPEETFAAGKGFWSTSGNRIIDASGKTVLIRGVNWPFMFGGSTSTEVTIGGGHVVNWKDEMKAIKSYGFNTLRLVFTNDVLKPDCVVVKQKFNKDLRGLNCFQAMEKIVEYSGEIGLRVILDRHRIRNGQGKENELWYGSGLTEQQWVDDWKMLAGKYKGNSTVIGADLHNEPHGRACWGVNACKEQHGGVYRREYDWKRAATFAGNEILRINPDWLIFVEGSDWGQTLRFAGSDPVVLSEPNKLVYSVHVYTSFGKTYYNSGQPNWTEQFDVNYGYLVKNNKAPVLIGETNYKHDHEQGWFKAVINHAAQNEISWTIWAWSPHPLSTNWPVDKTHGRVVEEDYITPAEQRYSILKPHMFRLESNNPTPNGKKGDANGDGRVDETDFDAWKANYGCSLNCTRTMGNFNLDSKVDGLDFAIWAFNYGK